MSSHSATHRTQIAQGLHQVTSHSIGPIVPRRWEQTDEVEIKGATGCSLKAVSVQIHVYLFKY